MRQLEKTAELEQKAGRAIPWLFHRDGKPIKDFRKAWTAACQRAGVRGKVPTISGARPSEILNVRECHVRQR